MSQKTFWDKRGKLQHAGQAARTLTLKSLIMAAYYLRRKDKGWKTYLSQLVYSRVPSTVYSVVVQT